MGDEAVQVRLDELDRVCGESAREARDAAFMAALRVQAGVLRSEAEAKLAKAHELDRWVAAIERGEAALPGSRQRVVLTVEDEPPRAAAQDVGRAEARVQPLDEEPGEEMVLLLDMFDSRVTTSRWFAQAVADAAGRGLSIADEDDRRRAAMWIGAQTSMYEVERDG